MPFLDDDAPVTAPPPPPVMPGLPNAPNQLATPDTVPATMQPVSPPGGPLKLDIPGKPTTMPAPARDETIKFWMDKGAPRHVAEGIADRVGAESGFKSSIMGDSGTSGGQYQEHNDRLARLKAFAEKQGKPWTDPMVQHEFAYSETQGGDAIATKHWHEILAAPNQQTAAFLWDKYFERSKYGVGGGFLGDTKISPDAVAEAAKHGKTAYSVDPQDILALLPSVDEGEAGQRKRSSLSKALGRGEHIQDLPEISGEMQKDGTFKISSYDGRHRLQELVDAGYTSVPVVFQGVKGEPKSVVGMSGVALPFNFSPVPAPPEQQGAMAHIASAVAAGAKEGFGDRPIGLPEDVGQALRGISGIVPVEAAARAVAAPVDLIGRSINAALYGAVRGGGQALGEVTGAASQPGFDPGIETLRNVVGPAQAFLGGAGVAPEMPRPGVPSIPQLADRAPNPVFGAGPRAMSAPVANFLADANRVGQVQNRAIDIINQRAAQDLRAGGAIPAEMARQLEAGRGEGMALADVAGENVRGLLGNVAREAGPGREVVKQWAVNRLGDVDRDSPLATSIEKGIEGTLATGSARTEARALAEQRAASKPLWDQAMSGGNIEPIEKQVAQDYEAASRAEASAKQSFDKAKASADLAERQAADQQVRLPKQPTRLSTFLVRSGGLQNQGGELSYILGDNRARPGLINKGGKTLDDAALDAWEAGYLPGSERPTINDLLDALAQDINRDPVYSELDAAAAQEYRDALARNAETDQRTGKRPGPGDKRISAGALQFARDKATQAEAAWKAARDEKAELIGVLEQGRLDGTAKAPGAVWSPYIGRLLKNPNIQEGIRRGYRIERNIADGENRPFNPREYAVIGQDEAGDPKIGAIPNMKLMAVAKEGLDAMLESDAYKDQLTGRLNKAGRAVKILRDGLLNEIDRLNPAYKPARDKWAGDSALIAAVRDGKNFHKLSPEEIREWFDSASESEKNFFRLGASDTMRDDLQRRVFGGDPSKAIINSPRARNQILPMFRSAEDAAKFLDQVKRARTMFNTPVEVLGNSKTAARQAEDLARRQGLDTAADLLHGVVSGAMGHTGSATYRAGRIANRYLNPFAPSPEGEMAVNAAIARILTDPKVRLSGEGGNLLARLPLPKSQNALQRGLLNYGAKFASPSGFLP